MRLVERWTCLILSKAPQAAWSFLSREWEWHQHFYWDFIGQMWLREVVCLRPIRHDLYLPLYSFSLQQRSAPQSKALDYCQHSIFPSWMQHAQAYFVNLCDMLWLSFIIFHPHFNLHCPLESQPSTWAHEGVEELRQSSWQQGITAWHLMEAGSLFEASTSIRESFPSTLKHLLPKTYFLKLPNFPNANKCKMVFPLGGSRRWDIRTYTNNLKYFQYFQVKL